MAAVPSGFTSAPRVLAAVLCALTLSVAVTSRAEAWGSPAGADPAPAAADDARPGTYAEMLAVLQDGGVLEASFDRRESLVVVTLTSGATLEVRYPASRAPSLVVAMLESGVRIRSLPDPLLNTIELNAAERVRAEQLAEDGTGSAEGNGRGFFSRFGVYVPLLIFLGFLGFLFRQRRRDRRAAEREAVAAIPVAPETTFADVAGCEEAIEDLRELVEFLRDPERFERLGAKVPRGALLVGPPGTGKTLLARAVAGEAGVPFFASAGSDFVELYVGVGAKRVRELFAKANEAGRAIIFLDEIDAVGRARSDQPDASAGAHIEQENTLIALLNELDGFTGTGVIVIGATNRPDVLDPALTRPGRLERRVQVPNPDRRGREQILRVHTENKPLAEDVDLAAVAKRTPGTSGAGLAHIANEAALEAARRGLDRISQSCFDDAIANVAMGRARHSAVVTERDRRITAWHEAGHALAALLEEHAEDPVAVSITPRGPAGGVTWLNGSDDQFLSRSAARAQLVVALAGRAGEELLLDGEFTQGAQSDLLSATQLAGQMVTRFGMTRRGLQVRSRFDGSLDEDSSDMVEELLREAMDRARTSLSTNFTALESLAGALLERGTLTAPEIRAAVAGQSLPAVARTPRRSLSVRGRVGAAGADAAPTPEDGDDDRRRWDRLRGRLRALRPGRSAAKPPTPA